MFEPGWGVIENPADREAFVNYLRTRLIPDLKESGSEATAADFETCIELIKFFEREG